MDESTMLSSIDNAEFVELWMLSIDAEIMEWMKACSVVSMLSLLRYLAIGFSSKMGRAESSEAEMTS
jgi:hypothetical protein